jgi:hypothetical protein
MTSTKFANRIVHTFKLDRETVDRVIATLEELVHEGAIRRIVVKNREGHSVMEVPLGVGLIGTALVPVWAAIGAIAALAADFRIQVERADVAPEGDERDV